MTLSPLGLQAVGSYAGEEFMVGEMSLEVETADGIITLNGGGGSHNAQRQTFNLYWNTDTPLDVTTVTSVIIFRLNSKIKQKHPIMYFCFIRT
jgi:hypothetical protein